MTNLLLKAPVALVLGAYLVGLGLGHYFPVSYAAMLIFGLALQVTGILLLRRFRAAGYVLLLAGFIPLGWGNYVRSQTLPADDISRLIRPGDRRAKLTGRLARPLEPAQKGFYIYLESEILEYEGRAIPAQGLVRLNFYSDRPTLEYGQRVRLSVALRYPVNYDNPGGFDYRAYLARKGIRVVGNVNWRRKPEILDAVDINPVWRAIYRFRAAVTGFAGQICPQPQAGLLNMMVWGERYVLPMPVREKFSQVGLAHLLAISGLNVSFLSLSVFGVMRLLLRLIPAGAYERLVGVVRPGKLAAMVVIPVVVFYTMINGSSNSAVRAAIMILTYMLAVILDRQQQMFNTLALAAWLILLHNPQAIYEIDFQLSFGCVFFILYTLHVLKARQADTPYTEPSRVTRIWKNIWEYLVVSVSAYLAALPLTVFYFYQVSPWGIVANLAGVPVSWPIVPLGLLSGAALPFSAPLAAVLVKLNVVFINLLLGVVDGISRLPGVALKISPPNLVQLILLYAALLLTGWLLKHSWKWLPVGVVLWGAIWYAGAVDWYWFNSSPVPSLLQVTFLDVGQGDATFIKSPDGRCFLVDGGGASGFDIGEQVLLPYLWSQKVSRVDAIIISHSHPDHIKGLIPILENLEVGEILQSPEDYSSQTYLELKGLAELKNVPIKKMAAGDSVTWQSGLKLFFLHPPRQPVFISRKESYRQENENPLVFILEYGATKILFPGDIDWKTEKYLIKQRLPLDCAVLKVPRRGAVGSSSFRFLDVVSPQWAVCSMRPSLYGQRWGLKTFDRYREKGINVWRTDLNGAVTMYTDGREVTWEVRKGGLF